MYFSYMCVFNSGWNFISQISNTNFYETTQGLEFGWVIDGDGCILGSGILSFPLINPQSSIYIEWESSPWYSSWASCSAEEIFLTISARLVNSTRWVEAGHVISSTQVQLPTRTKVLPHVIPHPFCMCWSRSASNMLMMMLTNAVQHWLLGNWNSRC